MSTSSSAESDGSSSGGGGPQKKKSKLSLRKSNKPRSPAALPKAPETMASAMGWKAPKEARAAAAQSAAGAAGALAGRRFSKFFEGVCDCTGVVVGLAPGAADGAEAEVRHPRCCRFRSCCRWPRCPRRSHAATPTPAPPLLTARPQPLYSVEYDDGDKEELSASELEGMLQHLPAAAAAAAAPAAAAAASREEISLLSSDEDEEQAQAPADGKGGADTDKENAAAAGRKRRASSPAAAQPASRARPAATEGGDAGEGWPPSPEGPLFSPSAKVGSNAARATARNVH